MYNKNQHDSTLQTVSANENENAFSELFQTVLNNLEEVYLLVDTSYTIIATNGEANARAKEFFGFPLKAGLNVLSLVPPEKQAPLKALYQRVFKGEHITTEKTIEAADVTTYHTICYKPSYNSQGRLAGALVQAKDTTNIKNREIEMQLSEERWRFALEGSRQGLWDWNIKTGKVFFSQSWKKLFGFAPTDVIENIDQWRQRVHPQDKKIVAQNLKSHFESSDPLFESIYRFKDNKGAYRWLLSRGKVLSKDETGQPLRMIGTHTDITDVHLLKQNYKTLFDANPLPSWTYHLQKDHFLNVNKAALKLYGYSEKEFMQMSMKQLLANAEEWKKGKETFFKNKTDQQHRKKNGDLITVQLTSQMLGGDHNNIAIVLAEDVTIKSAAEQALIKSNERFKMASRATSDVIYDWDMETGQLTWGDNLYTLFGYKPYQVMLKNWESYIHPDEQEDVLKSLYETINNPRKKNWKKEYRFITASGDYRYVMEKGFVIRNKAKKAIRMIGALQDITDIKQKQVELQKSNERFDAVMKATSEFIWEWNIEENSFYLDPYGLKKVLGVMKDSSFKGVDGWLERLHPADKEGAQKVIESIVAGTISKTFEREFRFRRDDGKYVYLHDRGIVIHNKEGKPAKLIGAAQDITLRRKLERELLQKELEKQKIISKATIDTQEQERGEIGRELHDNVNQVLTTTKLYLELAGLKPEMKDEMIRKSSDSIIYVINEIRQLSRSLMNPSIGDLGLVAAIKDLISNINSTRKLLVKLEATNAIEDLLTSDSKLVVYRILQEALNNAIRHSSATNVLICIKKIENNLELIVKDDGIGFNIADVKKGIGLKNIENRVYLINGRMQVITAPGKGCTLIVHFPFKKIKANPQ